MPSRTLLRAPSSWRSPQAATVCRSPPTTWPPWPPAKKSVRRQAKEALASTSGGAGEKTYSFVQLAGSTQVMSKLHARADLAGIEVATLVKRLAKKEHSAALAQSASRISTVIRFCSSAGEDRFAKARALI